MGARAMWKAEVSIGREIIPVKLYAAVHERKVRFRLLDEATQAPVRQQMIAADDTPIDAGAPPQKGIQLDEATYVIVTPEELAAIEPPESRTIAVERFVPPSAVAEAWYDRPYWLGPDGDAEGYFALVQALAASERVGIAHWTMRKKRYHGALRVRGEHLMLVRMRPSEEVVAATSLAAPTGRAADAKEVALAEQLVAALEGPFDPRELEGTYDDRVRALVEAKAAGEVVPLRRAKAKKATADDALARSLEASLNAVAGGKRHGA